MRLRMRGGLPSAGMRCPATALLVFYTMPHSCVGICLDAGMIVDILLVFQRHEQPFQGHCGAYRREGAAHVQTSAEFFNLYNHGFIRAAVGIPESRVADPAFNAARTVELMEQAWREQAVLILFPELGLSAYACDDLFHQQALLEGALEALRTVQHASAALPLITVVGLPLQIDHLLFNCAVVLYRGRILGVVPKTFLPNYREFYELRQFAPAASAMRDTVTLCGQTDIPFGERLLFRAGPDPQLTFHVEICEDVWVPIPPSCYAALAGATVLLNLSASNITIAKADYRRQLVTSQSARCLAAYMYSAAGPGESTTDLAWDGQAIISENGRILSESERFHYEPQLISSETDLEYLAQERMRQTSFGQCMMNESSNLEGFRRIRCSIDLPRRGRLLPSRNYDRFPYVPSDSSRRDERCREVYEI